ncbi:MAG: hypothetical protein M3Z41_03905, partial [Candidatus Eremiobacteraeota bacterium]|nr:hypothetical protein [Candidatus Eremiobacteraeota bacterium]
MFAISQKTQQFTAACLLALGVIALGACGGGGGVSNPLPQPVPQNPGATSTFPLNAAGMSIDLPSVSGFNTTFTLPANNATAGTNLTMKITPSAPAGSPALAPDMHVAIEFLYFTLTTNKDVRLNGFPGFKLTVPPSFNMGTLPVKIGFYDPVTGWQHVGNFTASSGQTFVFTPTSSAITLKAGVTYYMLPYTCGGPSPSPLPSSVIACAASGTGSIAVLCLQGKTIAFVGKGNQRSNTVEQVDVTTTGSIVHTYNTTFGPTE